MSNPRIDYSLIKERIIDILGEKSRKRMKLLPIYNLFFSLLSPKK
jgi:hypothetical protein